MFKDNDIVDVYYGSGYKIDDKQEYLGKGKYYQEVSRLVHEKLDDMGIKSPYIRTVYNEDGTAFVDYGSWSYFFKLRKAND